MSKHFEGFKQGKVLRFVFISVQSTTPCGLSIGRVTTTCITSGYYKNQAKNQGKNTRSPSQVILCLEAKQSMYCQLLCGLVQRDEVVSVAFGAIYATVLVQAIDFLENYWKELCSNIRFDRVSEWITDLSCRDSVSCILGEPNLELADIIEHECGQQSWEGIISRLWHKAKFIEGIVTGGMAQYIPTLEFYCNKLPIVSTTYASSETYFGINLNPLSKPEHVAYTFLPNLSYFEFIEVGVDGGTMDQIVDLVDVKLDGYYEPFGHKLFRCRVGDHLQVTGFYNNTPQFRFVRRKNTVLSVHVEPTTEEELIKALASATIVLDSNLNLMVTGFTCYADISTVPVHYVFYIELKSKVKNSNNVLLD